MIKMLSMGQQGLDGMKRIINLLEEMTEYLNELNDTLKLIAKERQS